MEESPPASQVSTTSRVHRAELLLKRFHQAHVLSDWEALDDATQQRLLDQIERIDWEQLSTLFQTLVVQKQIQVTLPATPWEPAQPISARRPGAAEEGRRVLQDVTKVRYGLVVVAGGSGSGLKFPHAKGLFPATPLSGTSLYESIVHKSKAAAHANGQEKMFPIVFMVSENTEEETRAFFEVHDFFGEPDRIRLSRQREIPVLDRRPGQEGRVVMRTRGEIAVGGAGHGDALDYTLTADPDVVPWLKELGVDYMHFLNVDNLLNPVGDPYFLGEHVISQASRVPGRAHISLLLIPKPPTGRMGNVIEHEEDGQRLQESIDYGLIEDVDKKCLLGHASLQIVSLAGLAESAPIPFMVAQKELQAEGSWVPVWKFERSSNNKKRYGALIRRESDDVFASIKKPSEESAFETPASAARLQSDHWKGLLRCAGEAIGCPFTVAETAVLELPWDADFMEPAVLGRELQRLGFPPLLAADTGYWVFPDLRGFREIPLSRGLPPEPRPTPTGRTARRWEDRTPDEQRSRALIAAFNNHFEHDPDLLIRAPGRNTLVGDHQDYPALPQDGSAQSFTIAWASQKNVLVAAKRRVDGAIKLLAVNHDQSFSISLDDLDGLAREAAHNHLPDIYGQEIFPWVRRILALLFSARHGHGGVRTGLPLDGAEFAIQGNVPIGGGQSSSAAFLVAMTLACNELFNWRIPRSDFYTLADLARSGEHQDYSPFITSGRCGYLDSITSLAAVEGKAVLINHGNYRAVESLDLSWIEKTGYRCAVLLSGLSRSLSETDYNARVEELSRLPRVLNRLLSRRDRAFVPRAHVHQFICEQWKGVASDLEKEDSTLARRARYIFEEGERTGGVKAAIEEQNIEKLVALVDASGEAMSMGGAYQISGLNRGPANSDPFPALDALREIVRDRPGHTVAARMMGGGGAGPLCVLLPERALADAAFAEGVSSEWKELTGLDAHFENDPPAAGADVVWRRPDPEIVLAKGTRRIETYIDALGDPVYVLVDESARTRVEVIASRGTVRSFAADIDGFPKAILYNPEKNPAENGAAPYLGPWINRIKDGRALFRGQSVHLMSVKGVRNDGDGHALHGLMTSGWHVDLDRSRIDADGIHLVSWIDPTDYTDRADVQRLFGPSRTVLTHRLKGDTLHIQSEVTHRGGPQTERIPVLAAVHPWFLLHRKKHEFAELTLPARSHRITWKRALPRLQMIPVPFLPALPIPAFSRHNFREGRRLGLKPYDDSYTHLDPSAEGDGVAATLKDWFRDVLIEVGILKGYNEFTVYRPGGPANVVALEPQISSINALGQGAPVDSAVPTIGPGESFETHMFIRVSSLSRRGMDSPFAARPGPGKSSTGHFPRLLSNGLEVGPLAEPQKTTTHKDAVRLFFNGHWHIYGTGHEIRDLAMPPPGRRPQRSSVLFHLVGPTETGPFHEESPPVLVGDFPAGIFEAPALVAERGVLHLFAQTTYYRLNGTIEHFTSDDGHLFQWVGTALRAIPQSPQGGVYDVDIFVRENGSSGKAPDRRLVYSGFSRDGGREDHPDPCIFLSEPADSWNSLFKNGAVPILTDNDVPWHNSHDPANPYYEWGLEGAQLMRLPNGRHLLLCVGFERRPGRRYMAAQRLFFALYDASMKLLEVSDPILPLCSGWDEYGHGSMMIDVNNPARLRLLFQARPQNADKRFRDTNTWRLFEAIFDISLFRA